MRFTFNNNYSFSRYQSIPVGGYTKLIEKVFGGVGVELGIDFLKDKDSLTGRAYRITYAGSIDQYFDYRSGALEYRSLKFETERHKLPNFQGNAVVNFTDINILYTRIVGHKHLDYVETKYTAVIKEYPLEWKVGDESYYPVNDNKNMGLLKKYRELANREDKVIFGGHLAGYKYYDMHQMISAAPCQVEDVMSTN